MSPSPSLRCHKAKKSLSQNYLIDPNLLGKIVRAAHLAEHSHVLEIGPGPGGLTRALLKAHHKVTAVELDLRFVEDLNAWNESNLTLIHADFLTLDLPPVDAVVANVPYQITTPILDRLLPAAIPTTITMQLEVARRILAPVGSADYSPLSLFAQYYAKPTLSFIIKRHLFIPAPNVDSAVVHFAPTGATPNPCFHKTVQTAFQKRRKMLRSIFPTPLLLEADIDPTARPQTLSCDAYLRLSRVLHTRE